jgi:hypothetical protein
MDNWKGLILFAMLLVFCYFYRHQLDTKTTQTPTALIQTTPIGKTGEGFEIKKTTIYKIDTTFVDTIKRVKSTLEIK